MNFFDTKYRYILLAILILSSLYWWETQQNGVERSQQKQVQLEGSTQRPLHPPPIDPSNSMDANSAEESKEKLESPLSVNAVPIPIQDENSEPVQDSLEFEVTSDGLAIAFSDIVLGRVPEGYKQNRGRFKPPQNKLWLDGVVPYFFDSRVAQKEEVLRAIQYINEVSGVSFVPYTGEGDAIVFMPHENRCASLLGRVGGVQPVYLSPDCEGQTILHELMHVLGFVHEQSRNDRDQYITIQWENVKDSFRAQFDKVPESILPKKYESHFTFNFNSIMIYPDNSFTKSSQLKTMLSNTDEAINPIERGLTDQDIERIQYLYFTD